MTTATIVEFRLLIQSAKVQKRRGLQQFAREKIIIPGNSELANQRYKDEYQPWTGLWFKELDKGWSQQNTLEGPSQCGKTFAGYVVPSLFVSFELEEMQVNAAPDENTINDKWNNDLRPAIQACEYAVLLPVRGPGSRNGRIKDRIVFRNGVEMRFMTGGGGDKSRANVTTRILIVTEANLFGRSGGVSAETNMIGQLRARYRRNLKNFWEVNECTPELKSSLTSHEYEMGSASKIHMPCVYCEVYVWMAKEDLHGWQGAENLDEAMERAAWVCPNCKRPWTESDRRAGMENAVLVHKGQRVGKGGEIIGEMPKTRHLGFRVGAANNLFVSAADVAKDEWLAQQAPDEESERRRICQFVHGEPVEPPGEVISGVSVRTIIGPPGRMALAPKGVIPIGTELVSAGVDIGKHLIHWQVKAWRENATPHTLDYGVVAVNWRDLGLESALAVALDEIDDKFQEGWPVQDTGEMERPAIALVDSGWLPHIAYQFCQRAKTKFLPSKGFGASQANAGLYHSPKAKGGSVAGVGERYHITKIKSERTYLVEIDVDHWKTWQANRIETPMGQDGAWTIFETANKNEHMTFAKHLTAEECKEEFIKGKLTKTWSKVRPNNHYLDNGVLCDVAAHIKGVRLKGQEIKKPTPKPRPVVETQSEGFEGYSGGLGGFGLGGIFNNR